MENFPLFPLAVIIVENFPFAINPVGDFLLHFWSVKFLIRLMVVENFLLFQLEWENFPLRRCGGWVNNGEVSIACANDEKIVFPNSLFSTTCCSEKTVANNIFPSNISYFPWNLQWKNC